MPMPGSAVVLRNKKMAAAADDFAFDHSAAPKVPQPNHPIQQRRSYHDLASEFKHVTNNRRHSMYEYDAVVSATINLSEFQTSVKKAEDVADNIGMKNPEVKVTPASSANAKDNDYDEVDFASEKRKGEVGTLAVAKPPPRSSSSGSSRESDNIGRSIARKAFIIISVNVAAISSFEKIFWGFPFPTKKNKYIDYTHVMNEIYAGRARTLSEGSGRWTSRYRT